MLRVPLSTRGQGSEDSAFSLTCKISIQPIRSATTGPLSDRSSASAFMSIFKSSDSPMLVHPRQHLLMRVHGRRRGLRGG
jgi:hypothetical protein